MNQSSSQPESYYPDEGIFAIYAKEQLAKIAALEDNWNSDGAVVTAPVALEVTKSILARVTDENTVFAYFSPTGDGGILVTWQAGYQKIEIEADYLGHVTLYVSDQAGQELVNDQSNPANFTTLKHALSDLSTRVQAENPSWPELFRRE